MKKSKSSLFLMELIIVIFFFSLTSAVCLEIFVKAHLVGENTKDLNNAVLYAENAGELFYEYGKAFPEVTYLVTDSVADNLRVSLDFSEDNGFLYLDYNCYRDSETTPIYSLSFKQHIKEVAHE